jgi:hypothetical protein
VHQVGRYPELHQDARSTKHKMKKKFYSSDANNISSNNIGKYRISVLGLDTFLK